MHHNTEHNQDYTLRNLTWPGLCYAAHYLTIPDQNKATPYCTKPTHNKTSQHYALPTSHITMLSITILNQSLTKHRDTIPYLTYTRRNHTTPIRSNALLYYAKTWLHVTKPELYFTSRNSTNASPNLISPAQSQTSPDYTSPSPLLHQTWLNRDNT